MEYNLRLKKKNFSIDKNFPKLSDNETIGVFVSGGMESTLLALLCREIYGDEKTKLYYTDHLFADSDIVKNIIRNNVQHISEVLEKEVIYFPSSKEQHIENAKKHVLGIKQYIKEKYNSKYGMLGFTKNFWEIEKILTTNMTPEQFTLEIKNNMELYPNLIEEYHYHLDKHINAIQNMYVHPDTWHMVRNPEIYGILLPISELNKHEIVDVYIQLGWYDILTKTKSCVDLDEMHCGLCFACQQRHDAFDIHGINDPTVYKNDYVKLERKILVKKQI